jgi:hypothetical protein
MPVSQHFIAVLKSKDGELRALRDVADVVKAQMTPLIDVMPPGVKDWRTMIYTNVDEHVPKMIGRIAGAWSDAPLLLDFTVDPTRELKNGNTVAREFFTELRAKDIEAIPVTHLVGTLVYQDDVRAAVHADRRGVCIRLREDDFDIRTLSTRLTDLIRFVGVKPESVDIVIDAGDVETTRVTAMALAVRAVIAALPNLEAYRSVTLVSAAFPFDLSGCKPQKISHVPRADWALYKAVVDQGSLARQPSYGDFAISHPTAVEFDPRKMRMSASIRYTTPTEWLILKGRAVDLHGWEQTAQLCNALVKRPEFCGADYSWGDQYIDRRARGAIGKGNATTWRRVGTTHHLTMVADQLSKLGAP